MIRWHKSDLLNRMYVNIGDGKKAAMPRYYKQKIYSASEYSEVSGYQKGEMEKRYNEMIGDREYWNSYDAGVIAAERRIKNQSVKNKI